MNKFQREIKFRCWTEDLFDRPNWKFIYFSLETLLDGYNNDRAMPPEGESVSRFQDTLIEQFIGHKDVNEKDIYEGDIVILCGYAHTLPKVIKFFANIGHDGGGGTHPGFCFTDDPHYYDHLDRCEIIGNIHENPDLAIEED